MLSEFKLVPCKPEASRELALRPPRPEKLHIFFENDPLDKPKKMQQGKKFYIFMKL